MKMFKKERNSPSKTTFLKLRRYPKDVFGTYYQIMPDPQRNDSYAEITRWCNQLAKDGLWVKIVGLCGSYVIFDSKAIIKLADELKKLQKIPEKRWDR